MTAAAYPKPCLPYWIEGELGMKRVDRQHFDRALHDIVRLLAQVQRAELEERARVALKFFRADQFRWAYYAGEPEPRLWVEL